MRNFHEQSKVLSFSLSLSNPKVVKSFSLAKCPGHVIILLFWKSIRLRCWATFRMLGLRFRCRWYSLRCHKKSKHQICLPQWNIVSIRMNDLVFYCCLAFSGIVYYSQHKQYAIRDYIEVKHVKSLTFIQWNMNDTSRRGSVCCINLMKKNFKTVWNRNTFDALYVYRIHQRYSFFTSFY